MVVEAPPGTLRGATRFVVVGGVLGVLGVLGVVGLVGVGARVVVSVSVSVLVFVSVVSAMLAVLELTAQTSMSCWPFLGRSMPT